MKRRPVLVALVLSAAAAGCANVERSRDVANPAVPGEVLAAQVCSICHGIDGNSVSPQFPRLAAQQQEYIVNQLKNFRGHGRSDPAGSEYMWGLSHQLTDKQIGEIAAYFSRQRPKPNAPGDPRLMALGKDVFENGIPAQNVIACASCHGPKGQGIGAFPRLANQHGDYIVKQLDVFQNTQGRPGTPMEFIAHLLTGGNKEAVAAYLQAFPN